ncbi:HlyD family secretion protein, partial [Pseudomonas sp. MPR-R1B]
MDRERYDALVTGGAVARRDADKFDAAAVSAEQDTARARALVSVSEETAGVTRSKRAGLEAALQTAHARVTQAQAAL